MKNINLSKYENNSITSVTIGIDDIKARNLFDNFRIIYMIVKTNFFFQNNLQDSSFTLSYRYIERISIDLKLVTQKKKKNPSYHQIKQIL
jgi:hypothetical protein